MLDNDQHPARALRHLDKSNLWNRTYELLKEKIICRDFPVDEKISVTGIADQLNVSRTPVRDALNRLESEGLVVTRPKVGTFVVAIDREIIDTSIDTRLMIELWTAAKLAEGPESTVSGLAARLGDILAGAKQAIQEDLRAYHVQDFNLLFHMAFVEAGANSFNTRAYISATHYRLPASAPGLVADDEIAVAMAQHEEIVQAIENRSFVRLQELVRLHLEDSRRRLLAKVKAVGGRI